MAEKGAFKNVEGYFRGVKPGKENERVTSSEMKQYSELPGALLWGREWKAGAELP